MIQDFLGEVAIAIILVQGGDFGIATVYLLLHAAHRLIVTIGE